jgi:hypothetical protein
MFAPSLNIDLEQLAQPEEEPETAEKKTPKKRRRNSPENSADKPGTPGKAS